MPSKLDRIDGLSFADWLKFEIFRYQKTPDLQKRFGNPAVFLSYVQERDGRLEILPVEDQIIFLENAHYWEIEGLLIIA